MGEDYTDDVMRMVGHHYDDADEDHLLWGSSWTAGDEVDSDLTYVSGDISPTNDTYMGVWDAAGTNPFLGQICEIIVYDRPLNNPDSQREDLQGYLSDKWGIF